MDEQVMQLMDEYQAKLKALMPKMTGAVVGVRDPKKVNELRMMVTGFASNLMFYGLIRNNDVAMRASNYFGNIASNPDRWEEFVNMIYGPA